jgi:hypothetical protein
VTYVTVTELAQMAGIATRNVNKAIADGRLQTIGRDGRAHLISFREANRFAKLKTDEHLATELRYVQKTIRAAGGAFITAIDRIIAAARAGLISVTQACSLVLADDPIEAWNKFDRSAEAEDDYSFLPELLAEVAA